MRRQYLVPALFLVFAIRLTGDLSRAEQPFSRIPGATGSVHSATLDYEAGWVAGKNPNGVWSYGWSSGLAAPITLFSRKWLYTDHSIEHVWDDPDNNYGAVPKVSRNSGGDCDDGNVSFNAGVLALHHGTGTAYAHVIFTAPSSGLYSVAATFYAQQHNISADVHVLVGGKAYCSETISALGESHSCADQVELKAGQTVDFAVGPNGRPELHPGYTGLEAVVAQIRSSQDEQPAYHFTTIDPPGSVDTIAKGINAQGDIVGRFWDEDGNMHGFLLSDGKFRVIDVRRSTIGAANGINSSGDIVGTCEGGYLLSAGRVVRIGFPGAVGTTPLGINGAGDIVGTFDNPVDSYHGFLLSGGKYTQIDFPGACYTVVDGINEAGDIVGNYRTGTCDESNQEYHGFLYRNGNFTMIDVPNAVATVPSGINAQADVVGSYDTAEGTYGFVMRNGLFTRIEFPDALFTRAFGINARGWIVGNWRDSSRVRRGFLATK